MTTCSLDFFLDVFVLVVHYYNYEGTRCDDFLMCLYVYIRMLFLQVDKYFRSCLSKYQVSTINLNEKRYYDILYPMTTWG